MALAVTIASVLLSIAHNWRQGLSIEGQFRIIFHKDTLGKNDNAKYITYWQAVMPSSWGILIYTPIMMTQTQVLLSQSYLASVPTNCNLTDNSQANRMDIL